MYTYRFADLLTDRDVAELELDSVRFDRRIIVPGSFSCSIQVANEEVAARVKNIIPGKTVCYVYRNQEIWGAYIIWTMRVTSPQRGPVKVDLTGATMESWLYRRLLDQDLTFNQVDQITIARELIETAQTGWTPFQDNADLGIETLSGTSGFLRDRLYKRDEAATVGQRLEELANVDSGFEYIIDVYYDPSTDTRRRLWKWGYPALGESNNFWSFQQPGNILGFELTYDAVEGATAFWTRGDSIEDDVTEEAVPLMTTSPAFATEYMVRGFPHLDKVVDYSGVTSLVTLENYAAWWRDNRGGVILIPQIEVRGDDLDSQLFTPARLGEYASIAIENVYFPLISGAPGYSGNFRVVGLEVTPDQRGEIERHRFIIAQDFDPTEIGG